MLALLLFSAALAQDLPAAPGLIEIIPPGEALGDGLTGVDLRVVALHPDGQPWTGLELVPGARSGSTEPLVEDGPGQYHFRWTPDHTTSPRDAHLFLKGRTPDKVRVRAEVVVPVLPPRPTAMRLSADPSTLLLGRDAETSVRIQVDPVAGPRTADQLRVHATAGTLENLTPLGDGELRVRWLAPTDDDAGRGLALITVSDARQPTRSYGALALSLQESTTLDVEAPAGTSVLVRAGEREFGPAPVPDSGTVSVPVTLGPELSEVTVITADADGQVTQEPLPLEPPSLSRVHLLPVHPSVPGDSAVSVPVRAVVFDPFGLPDAEADLQLWASDGAVSAPRHEGSGVYAATWTPNNRETTGEVQLTAMLRDEPAQRDAATVSVVPLRPATLTLGASPNPLRQGAGSVDAIVTLSDSAGDGLAAQPVSVEATGGSAGEVVDVGMGTYRSTVTPAGSGPIDLRATVHGTATDNPLWDLVVVPARSYVPHDAISTVPITIVPLDEYGYPVEGVEVELSVLRGGGSLPERTTTDAHGTSQLFYTSGREAGLACLEARAGGHRAVACMLQGPAVLRDVPVVPSGDARAQELYRAWQGLTQRVRVERR